MARISSPGTLIGDDEIRQRFGAEADTIIAELDKNRTTQAYKAMWNGNRYRPAVEPWLANAN